MDTLTTVANAAAAISRKSYIEISGSSSLLRARIVQTPRILGGKPRIAGHRISVQDIVIWHEHMGMSSDTIAAKYDLALEDINAALQYYMDHPDEIKTSIQVDADFVAESRRQQCSVQKAQRDG
jgi:uncharacterized protein (DUF433 family)